MTAAVLVDTNVLLYAHDALEPVKQQRAAAWIDHLWSEKCACTSVQALSEFYYNATRKLRRPLTHDAAWNIVHAFRAWRPQPVDDALLERARDIERRHRLNWWDALIVGAAQLQSCSILLTEDLQDRAVYDGVTVCSPFTLAVGEEPAGYAAVATIASTHPKRGRPRRARPSPGPAPA